MLKRSDIETLKKMDLSPESPTSDYTENFDKDRDMTLEYIDVENLSEGDNILYAKCFVCSAPATGLDNALIACLHEKCETYICNRCVKNNKVRRGMKCTFCPAKFWVKKKLWKRCSKCHIVRCRSCQTSKCQHFTYGLHVFN